MRALISLFRTTTFVIMLIITLVTSTISLGVWAVSLTTQIAVMSTSAAAAAIASRKQIAKAVLRTKTREKAKARLRRVVVAVPVAGAAAAVYFERSDYLEWQKDNPNKELSDYGCEVGAVSAEVIDEVLQDLPEAVRPSRDLVLSQIPDCEGGEG